jgi:peptidyl-tRNA hydrolase
MIRLFVGLGNPGPEYEATRHNAGFWWVDALADKLGARLVADRGYHGHVARVNTPQGPVWLLQPMTYMNRSGSRWWRWRASSRSCPTRSWSCTTNSTCSPARPS